MKRWKQFQREAKWKEKLPLREQINLYIYIDKRPINERLKFNYKRSDIFVTGSH